MQCEQHEDFQPAESAPQPAPTKVDKAVVALLADWERQDGVLQREQFERTVLKRNLDAEEIIEVIRRLRDRGIPINQLDPDEGVNQRAALPNRHGASARSADFVFGYGKSRLLSHDEHVRLSRTVQIGLHARRDLEAGNDSADLKDLIRAGERARDKMVIANIRLVLSIARRQGRADLEFTDQVQNGIFGLIRAVEMFDPELGLRFSTYAQWWIRQSIWRANDNESLIRIPVHRLEKIKKLRRMTRRLAVEFGRDPNVSELAAALDWPPEKTSFIQRLGMFRTTSIDAPLDQEEGLTVGDLLPSSEPSPEQIITKWSRNKLLNRLMDRLPEKQRHIVDRRFGLSSGNAETLQEIGVDFGVTRERIRQIESKAMRALYHKALKYMKALMD